MINILLDSSFLVALLDPQDVWHPRANQIDKALSQVTNRVFLDIVISESLSVIARRFEEQKRSKSFSAVVKSFHAAVPASKVVWLSLFIPQYYDDILQMMIDYKGELNFNDCLIALYMKDKGHRFLVSFDPDFDAVPGIQRLDKPDDVKKYLRQS